MTRPNYLAAVNSHRAEPGDQCSAEVSTLLSGHGKNIPAWIFGKKPPHKHKKNIQTTEEE